MKKNVLFTVLVLMCICCLSLAQPKLFNYQGIARNGSGAPLSSRTISLRISILDSIITGPAVYTETHSVTTNAFGLFNIAIGGGTVVSGHMDSVKWGINDKFIKVEMDTSGGSSYVTVSTTQLLSVPYALYARHSGTTSGVNITSFQPSICSGSLSSFDSTYHKIKDIGTFTTYGTGSKVELTLSSDFSLSSSGTLGVVFELRVDGSETTIGKASLYCNNGPGSVPGTMSGVFSGLSAGTHTLSIWIRAVDYYFGGTAYVDGMCTGHVGSNGVIVKEYQ